MESELFDLQQLHELSAGNPEFVRRMVHLFAELVQQFNDRAANDLISGDYNDLGDAAHKIKASVDMMGIRSLYDPIRELERFCKSGIDQERIPELTQQITEVLNRVVRDLKLN